MKLSISREVLLSPLQMISGVVERKQTMPVLSNVLLVADNGVLTVTGTNMEVELVSRVDSVEVESNGQITVPARKLFDICRSLQEGVVIEMSLEGDKLHLRAGRSHFTLSTLPAEHFPNVEDSGQETRIQLPQGKFKAMLDATAFAMAQQDVRYYLNGMLLELDTNLVRAVATDGHRLALSTCEVQTGMSSVRQVIVPRKGIQELSRLLSDSDDMIEISLGDNHVRSHIGHFSFTSKLIEGKFPDYNRVVPKGGDKVMLADRESLKGMLMRAGILSHENIRGVRLQFSEGQLKVSANNPEHEQAEDYLEVDYRAEGMEIGFNVGYLIDVLNVISDDQVKMTLSNPNSSALIESSENSNDLYVVMPMRL